MERLRRVFVAVGLSAGARRALTAWVEDAGVPGRLVPAENLHVTIRWVGDTELATLERLLGAIDESALPAAFDLRLEELGAFPKPRRATVVWVRAEAGALAQLHAVVEEASERAGLGREERPFRPHLTVSRVRPVADVRKLLGTVPPAGVVTPVTELAVLCSSPGNGPARYDLLDTIRL